MPKKLDPKIVKEWALRLQKDPAQIRRLIKARKLPNRYPKPNEGLPVPPALKGKIPLPKDYIEWNIGQRNKPPKKSLAGRFDALLGKPRSAREKLWGKVFTTLNDRSITSSEAEALLEAFNVMLKAACSSQKMSKALTEAVELSSRRMQQRKKVTANSAKTKARNTIKSLSSELSSLAAANNLARLSERDIRHLRKFQKAVQAFVSESKRAKNVKKWTQERIARFMGLSKSGYRKFLERTDLQQASKLIQLYQRKSTSMIYIDPAFLDQYQAEY